MTLLKVNREDLEQFTIVTNPIRHYFSSSTGVVGNVHVYARRSDSEKEIAPLSSFVDSIHNDADLATHVKELQSLSRKIAIENSGPITPEKLQENNATLHESLVQYMDKVSRQGKSAKKQKTLDIIRFTPSVSFTSNTARKLVVKDLLNEYYRVAYPTAHWAYSNYNTLNFFTSSTVPTSNVLLYPNVAGPIAYQQDGHESGIYSLSGAFSFDFYINPRYQQSSPDSPFNAGTIFHLSSSYALSLITGSAKDHNGKSTGFKMLLQLSHSADIPPSQAIPGGYPRDLIFESEDNSLSHNKWHRVVVRWGTDSINFGTGSFNIDGVDKGYFVIPSGTVSPKLMEPPLESPEVLAVGNFFEGENMTYFFAKKIAERDGLIELNTDESQTEPASYSFTHPLNAELHDLCIRRKYLSTEEIAFTAGKGPVELDDTYAFYCPPFFTEQSPFRKGVDGYGGVLQTPFFEVDGSTNDPFNVALSFGCNGHYINIENFVRDFANDSYPRCHHMTASVIVGTTTATSANDFLYENPFVRARNLLILPCDDGNFTPNYNLLAVETNRSKFSDDFSTEELSFINLSNMLSTSSLLFGTTFDPVEGTESVSAKDFVNELIGFTPENPFQSTGSAYKKYVEAVNKTIEMGVYDPGIQAGAPLTIYQRTRDPSSNQVTFFDISNFYYGKRIKPGSFAITDASLSGSGNAVKITLKDDGYGNLYRADSLTTHSDWNSCGNIYYSEGIVVVKNPHLYFYGKDSFEISFRGEQNVHSLKMDVVAPQNMLNSSSNPSFIPGISASDSKTDVDPNFVYITGLNFHDDNLNVVAKTQLAQPIVKRWGDKIMFKVSLDF